MRPRLIVLLVCAITLTACSPATTAVMGVSVDAAGGLVGVVAVCSGHTDEARLTVWKMPAYTAPSSPAPDTLTTGEWQTDRPATDVSQWSLTTGAPWTTTQSIRLVEGFTYELTGIGRGPNKVGNESRASGITFTLADVAALKPGQVRYAAGVDEKSLDSVPAVVNIQDFRATVCR
jgi:hypothetical protein